jgi:hypothetical protein
MRRRLGLPALAIALVAAPGLAGCAPLVPEIIGRTSDTIMVAPDATPLDPAQSPVPASTPAFISSPDGYALAVPAGWTAAQVAPGETALVLDMLASSDPTLANHARSLIAQAGATVSMVGGDLGATSTSVVPPSFAVVVLPATESDDQTRQLVRNLLDSVPRQGNLGRKVIGLPAGDADRYQVTVVGDAAGPVTMRVFLFTAGPNAVLVAFAAGSDIWSQADPAFDATINSLRFGV